MTSDLDIFRSANLLIDQHGDDVAIEAAICADAMIEKGAMGGAAICLRTVTAVEGLLDTWLRPHQRLRAAGSRATTWSHSLLLRSVA